MVSPLICMSIASPWHSKGRLNGSGGEEGHGSVRPSVVSFDRASRRSRCRGSLVMPSFGNSVYPTHTSSLSRSAASLLFDVDLARHRSSSALHLAAHSLRATRRSQQRCPQRRPASGRPEGARKRPVPAFGSCQQMSVGPYPGKTDYMAKTPSCHLKRDRQVTLLFSSSVGWSIATTFCSALKAVPCGPRQKHRPTVLSFDLTPPPPQCRSTRSLFPTKTKSTPSTARSSKPNPPTSSSSVPTSSTAALRPSAPNSCLLKAEEAARQGDPRWSKQPSPEQTHLAMAINLGPPAEA